ncbi:MAG: type II secretion system protein [Proteobacteria bacterium]|nr:type II secretion system protein [Pseudomonadota bacterium]
MTARPRRIAIAAEPVVQGIPVRAHNGFTLVELIVVMIVIGILAVVVVPRFSLLQGYNEVGFRDKVKATLEYARKSAVAMRRTACITRAANNLTLQIETVTPETAGAGTCVTVANLSLPAPDNACGGPSNQVCAPSGVTLTGPLSLSFSPLGKPSALASYVTGPDGNTITVEAETGYVH